jgi:hypothetical protein
VAWDFAIIHPAGYHHAARIEDEDDDEDEYEPQTANRKPPIVNPRTACHAPFASYHKTCWAFLSHAGY